jgi:hypothetical protein
VRDTDDLLLIHDGWMLTMETCVARRQSGEGGEKARGREREREGTREGRKDGEVEKEKS